MPLLHTAETHPWLILGKKAGAATAVPEVAVWANPVRSASVGLHVHPLCLAALVARPMAPCPCSRCSCSKQASAEETARNCSAVLQILALTVSNAHSPRALHEESATICHGVSGASGGGRGPAKAARGLLFTRFPWESLCRLVAVGGFAGAVTEAGAAAAGGGNISASVIALHGVGVDSVLPDSASE